MRSKRKKEEDKADGGRWAYTYSDMITLLLVFFIVLYTLSRVDIEKFQVMALGLKSEFGKTLELEESPARLILSGGVNDTAEPLILFDRFVPPVIKEIETTDMEYPEEGKEISPKDMDEEIPLSDSDLELVSIAKELEEKLIGEKAGSDVKILLENNLLIVIIKTEGVLFESGSAKLKKEILPTLNMISEALECYQGLIMVEGHTDNIPINTAVYPSNWELSSGRASSVLRYWVENELILASDIVAAGYADTKPVASNDTAEGRGRNRRVEIRILSRADAEKLGR